MYVDPTSESELLMKLSVQKSFGDSADLLERLDGRRSESRKLMDECLGSWVASI
jgi:hypothetical protein